MLDFGNYCIDIDATKNNLVNFEYVPKGTFTLNNISTKPTKLFSQIKKIKTAVTITDTTININDLTFLIGNSDIHINTLIKNLYWFNSILRFLTSCLRSLISLLLLFMHSISKATNWL